MNERTLPKKRRIEPVYLAWTALCLCALAVMLIYAANKTIVIAEIPAELPNVSGAGAAERYPLRVEQTPDAEGHIYIPLPRGIRPENVAMDNRYLEDELWLYIQMEDEYFYDRRPLTGDVSVIRGGSYEAYEDGVLLRLQMQGLMEYRSTLEGDRLVVACHEPGQLHDCAILLDPMGVDLPMGVEGSMEGSHSVEGDDAAAGEDVTLSVARLVQERLNLEGVRVYLTRTGGRMLSAEEKLALAEKVHAEIYIGLRVADAEDPASYGICGFYNKDYFIPELTNAELADLLTREVTTAASGRALGVEAAESDSLLMRLEIPAAEVSLGCLSNPKERELLMQEGYQVKLAEGILGAVDKVHRRLVEGETD